MYIRFIFQFHESGENMLIYGNNEIWVCFPIRRFLLLLLLLCICMFELKIPQFHFTFVSVKLTSTHGMACFMSAFQ